jgi:hypothetical protein
MVAPRRARAEKWIVVVGVVGAGVRRALALAVAALLTASNAAAGPPHIRVKGTARIDARAARASGKLVLSGTVVDDSARPLGGARVTVAVATETAPVNLSQASAEPCWDGAARPVLEQADRLSLPTDDAARFCVRLLLPTDRYVVHLESRGTGAIGELVEPARLDLPVDLALEPVTLRFDPERSVLSLDDETPAVLEVVASTEDDGVTTASVGIPLVLKNETGAALGSATTNASGRARFAVDPWRLGAPGKGELRVSFAGSSDAGASTHAMQVERRTRVDLGVPDAVEGRLPVGSPEDGVSIRVVATARCARRGCFGPSGSPSGTVEARVGDDGVNVAAASLQRGEAQLVATFAMPAGSEVPLRLRFVPDAPWFQPGGELVAMQPVRASSPWKMALLVICALIAVAWLAIARLPPRPREASERDRHEHPHLPEAGVALVREGPAARGWTGRVHDAHDNAPVPSARVAVERRGFERIDRIVEVVADEQGAFALPPLEAHPGDELVADGPLHAQVRRPLPPSGELDVALVLRRRALLDRLVAWARKRGKPFDARPEPTPGHVRRAANSEFTVARWADAVERAAYAGAVVDEHAQGEVDRLAPPEPAEAPPPGPGGRRPGAR